MSRCQKSRAEVMLGRITGRTEGYLQDRKGGWDVLSTAIRYGGGRGCHIASSDTRSRNGAGSKIAKSGDAVVTCSPSPGKPAAAARNACTLAARGSFEKVGAAAHGSDHRRRRVRESSVRRQQPAGPRRRYRIRGHR